MDKKILSGIAGALLLITLFIGFNQYKAQEKIKNAANVTLKVKEITCNSCVTSIKKALKSKDIYKVDVNIDSQEVTVYYNEEKESYKNFITTLEKEGYKAHKKGGELRVVNYKIHYN